MSEQQKRPLVSFALFAFNQEKYIRHAVASALAQDYFPLQVILSDDGSSDATWSIMQEMAAEYSGPHTIVLNRNEPNLGVTSHVNKVVGLATADLIVVAAGDDISRHDRTRRIVERWCASGRPSGVVHSGSSVIDEDGRDCQRSIRGIADSDEPYSVEYFMRNGRMLLVHGATAAYTRDVFDRFGPLLPNGLVEDKVLALRALLIGRLLFIDEPLVDYRVANTSISRGAHSILQPEKWIRWAEAQSLKFENQAQDYKHFCRTTGARADRRVLRWLYRMSRRFRLSKDLVSTNLARRAAAIALFPGAAGLRDTAYFMLTFYGLRRS